MKRTILAAASVLGLGVAISMTAVQPSSGQAAGPHQSVTGHSRAPAKNTLKFDLKRSAGVIAADCLDDAGATVTVKPTGQVEKMTIKAHDLVPNSEYDVFIIQVPNAPFGMSWYQGDLESDYNGDAVGHYTGRFNIETFAITPDTAPNAQVFDGDGTASVKSPPIHTYHVGIWFGSPKTAAKAGCPETVTPFNGEHDAGIQALATTQFDDLNGPLRQLD